MTEEEVKLKNHKELDMTNWPHCISLIFLNVPILFYIVKTNDIKQTKCSTAPSSLVLTTCIHTMTMFSLRRLHTEFVECGKDMIILLEVLKHQSGISPILEILVLLIPSEQGY